MAASLKSSTIVAVSAGVAVTGILAYAVYFDHRRRTDPEFRKALKKESKRQAKAAKEEALAQSSQQKKLVRQAVDAANEEGFPSDPEEVEAYFMQEVARGEQLCQEGAEAMDAALCFYRALKVYPQPRELITIYDKTVPKPVLDVLAEMIAVDSSIPIGKQTPAGSADGETGETD